MKTRIVKTHYGYMPQIRICFLWCDLRNGADCAFTSLEYAKDYLEDFCKVEEIVWESSK